MTELRQRFGRLVAAHRRQQGWTQEALATAAAMSIDMISRIENGTTGASFSTIAKLSEALEVDPADLFSPELAQRSRRSKPLDDLVAKLAVLSDNDLRWLDDVIEAALKKR